MVISLVMAFALVLGGLTCGMPVWAASALQKTVVPVVLPKPKKIQHAATDLLGAAFKLNPAGLVVMGMTKNRAETTLQSIEQFMEFHEHTPSERAQAAYAEKMMTYVIAPTVVFFDSAKSFKEHIKPLIVQSVGVCPHLKSCAGSAAEIAKKSLLIQFFDAPHTEVKQDTLPVFFAQKITNVAALRAICWELVVFLQDLYESLPEDVKALYNDLREQVAKKKSEHAPQS